MTATWIVGGEGWLRYVLPAAALLLLVALVAVARADEQVGRTRQDVLHALSAAERELAQRPEEPAARHDVARLLYESGDFWRAAEVIEPVVQTADASPQAVLLAAELSYLRGRYAEAEALYQRVLGDDRADKQSQIKAKIGLGFAYYQTNRFDRFEGLTFDRGVIFPGEKTIRAFDAPPYQVRWDAAERTSTVPFLVTDPLPVMTVQYNGRPVHVLFDTGADTCIVDTKLAGELGIKEDSWSVGSFGGGKLGRYGYGRLQSVKIGQVELTGVPAFILPTERFSSAFAGGKYPIQGIVGTALVRQFLATLDYQHEQLVLRPRADEGRQALRRALDGQAVTEVPFVLSGTHWMMARGSLDGREGLTFFVDSGLAADAAFSAPPQTLRYAGIPIPETKRDPNSVGGGGGAWASGTFAIRSLGLGPLVQHNLKGEFGSRPASSYWQSGFIQDGLISHGFLRQYDSWSIDFDAMTYLFASAAAR